MLKKNLSNISKKSKMIAATAFVLGATAISGGAIARAEEVNTDFNPMGELVSTIAEKFGLNKDEVQAVVDEAMESQREEMQAKHHEVLESRLEEAVSDGKLTQTQSDVILKKAEEWKDSMEDRRDEHKDLTLEERKEQMEKNRTELEKWAKDNDLTKDQLQYLGGGRGMKGGMGGGMGFGPKN